MAATFAPSRRITFTTTNWSSVAVLCAMKLGRASAHEHHADEIPNGAYISQDPIALAWGVIFPTGMVLGIVKSRWHVPIQTTGVILAILGYFLGHAHKGRQFAPNIHMVFATSLSIMLALQVIMGIYLKLHLEKGIHSRIRRYTVKSHGILGKLMPVVSWVQMLFGGITAMGFCHEDHLGQCLAHFIMGSAFIGYGVVLTILLMVGQIWLRRTGRSQEFFDSLLIAAWGCVNTFTEHRWGQNWSKSDYQHTSMGIVWWCAGLLGVWLSRKRDGTPQRNLIPGIVILLTGWAMSSHPQHLAVSTKVHTVFGYTLMAAGSARIIEIAFVLRDKNSVDAAQPEEGNSFQFMTPFLLYSSGFIFMGANEEQMAILAAGGVGHVAYLLILYSIAFLLFLYVSMLLTLYSNHTWPVLKRKSLPDGMNGNAVDGLGLGQHARDRDRRIREAEEFELEGLMTDDEAMEGEDSLGSPGSSVGKEAKHI